MSYAQLDAVVSKAEDIFDHFGVSGTIVFHGSEPLLMKKTLWEVVERIKIRTSAFRRMASFLTKTMPLL